MPTVLLKVVAVAALIFTMLALIEQREFEKSRAYRTIADEVKIIYDRAESCFLLGDFSEYENLRVEWEDIRRKLSEYPIGRFARWRSQLVIKSEMNLSWLGGEYS